MKTVLFIDVTCPKPYSAKTLQTEPLGGTEATVVRIAEELNKDFKVKVLQHCRQEQEGIYYPFSELDQESNPHAIVCLRDPKPLPFLQNTFKDAKLFLWLHDLCDKEFGQHVDLLNDVKPHIIGVSEFHKTHIIERSKAFSGFNDVKFTVSYIYNPVTVRRKNGVKVDKNKFLFMSSPHKGLSAVIKTFGLFHKRNPKAKLYVANPGYLPNAEVDKDFIVQLGSLTHSEVIEHLRSSFALFYPNPDPATAETFGIVVAEAQAVGTPCVVANQGALREIVSPREQLVDAKNPIEVCQRIEDWYTKGKPKTKLDSCMRLKKVREEWQNLLQ